MAIVVERTESVVSASLATAWASQDEGALRKFKNKELQELCVIMGLTKTGRKDDLVARLTGAVNIALLAKMKRTKQYLPRDGSCGMAILSALDAARRGSCGDEDDDKDWGLSKAEIMRLAEATQVYSGSLYDQVNGYDGWSCTETLTARGPLMCQVDEDLFALANPDVAAAVHARAHLIGKCQCGSPPPPSEATRPLNALDLSPNVILDDDPLAILDDPGHNAIAPLSTPAKPPRVPRVSPHIALAEPPTVKVEASPSKKNAKLEQEDDEEQQKLLQLL